MADAEFVGIFFSTQMVFLVEFFSRFTYIARVCGMVIGYGLIVVFNRVDLVNLINLNN